MKYDFDASVERDGTYSSKWKTSGDELPMWVADMDFKVAPEILEALQKRLDNGVFGYSYVPHEWSEAICSWWSRRHDVKFDPSWLIFCTGVIPIISSAVRKFTSVGDKIVVQSPVYHVFYRSIENNGRVALTNELAYDGRGYDIDFKDLEEKLADPLTTMFILCNPHNPVGKIWSEEKLAKIGELCANHGVLVVSDEIHCDITSPGKNYVPFIRASETCKNISITCVSPTKAFNIAGLQSSAAVVPNPKLRAKMAKAINDDEVGEGNAFSCIAAIAAFERGEAWLEQMREYVEQNRKIVSEFLQNELPQIRLVEQDATYLLWLDCREICDDASEFHKFLRQKAGLWLNDGNAYRGAEKCFLRLNIATQRSRVLEGLKRLKSGAIAYAKSRE